MPAGTAAAARGRVRCRCPDEVKRSVNSLKLVWGGRGQEAQQESLEKSVVKDWAAALVPSAMVR